MFCFLFCFKWNWNSSSWEMLCKIQDMDFVFRLLLVQILNDNKPTQCCSVLNYQKPIPVINRNWIYLMFVTAWNGSWARLLYKCTNYTEQTCDYSELRCVINKPNREIQKKVPDWSCNFGWSVLEFWRLWQGGTEGTVELESISFWWFLFLWSSMTKRKNSLHSVISQIWAPWP